MNPLFALFSVFLGLLGLIIGSFLNVVIARVPRGESIVFPGSHCPKCGHELPWYENVPVFSWVLLRGRCSSCKAPISPRYVVVELLTAVLYLGLLSALGWTWGLVQGLAFVTLLVPLIFIDAETWLLPFELTLPGIAMGVLLRVPYGVDGVVGGLIGAAVGFASFRAMEAFGFLLFRKEAMGDGDKYLMALIGAFLGWKPLLAVVLFASLQGSVVGVLRLLLTGRAGPATGVPPVTTTPPPGPGPTDVAAPLAPPAPAPESGAVAPTAEAPAAESPAPVAPATEPPAPALAPAEEPEPRFTPAFLEPGLSLARRALLLPVTLLVQPIPDLPELDEETGEEPEWTPGVTNLPFGPWLGLAALELAYFGTAIVSATQGTALGLFFRLVLH